MSTVTKVNFEPVSDVDPIHRRDWELADTTLIVPTAANCIVDGEWLTLSNTAGASLGKAVRATNIASGGDPATTLAFPVWSERGRYDVQALGRGVTVLFMGQYEFDTRIYDAAADIGNGDPITQYLQPLKVATITIGARNYTGLVGSLFNDNAPVVGYVTRLPATNGAKLRFMSGWAVRNGTT